MKSKLSTFRLYFEDLVPDFYNGKLKAIRRTDKIKGGLASVYKSAKTKLRPKFPSEITIRIKWLFLLMPILILYPHHGATVYSDPISLAQSGPIQLLKPLEQTKLADLEPLQAVYIPPPSIYTPPVAKTSYSLSNSYDYGYCTWYVASLKAVPGNLGNANTWAAMAAADGFIVSNVPAVGTVAQTSAYSLGHVALVTAVGSGTVTVTEMNYNGFGISDSRTTPVSDWVYLYF